MWHDDEHAHEKCHSPFVVYVFIKLWPSTLCGNYQSFSYGDFTPQYLLLWVKLNFYRTYCCMLNQLRKEYESFGIIAPTVIERKFGVEFLPTKTPQRSESPNFLIFLLDTLRIPIVLCARWHKFCAPDTYNFDQVSTVTWLRLPTVYPLVNIKL